MPRPQSYAVGGRGWTRFTDRSTNADVMVRFRIDPEDGRARAVQAVVTLPDDAAVALGEAIRGLLWGQIETLANHPYVLDLIRDRIDEDIRLTPIETSPNAGGVVSDAVDAAAGPWKPPRATEYRVSPKLEVPSSSKYPDSFYKEFAAAYSSLAAYGLSPAVVLSEANGVARSTLHRWAKESRRRGLLGAGRRGQAG